MRLLFTLLAILALNHSFGQDFQLYYSTVGLGSNATWFLAEAYKDCASGLKIEIKDTILTYSNCNSAKQRNFYTTEFRRASIDSIVYYLDTLQGKSIFRTNPNIMSGAIFKYSIEYQGKCSQFVLKNTYDNTTLIIASIINSYLCEEYQIHIPSWGKQDDYKPLIESCPRKSGGTYSEILGQEYDVLRNNE